MNGAHDNKDIKKWMNELISYSLEATKKLFSQHANKLQTANYFVWTFQQLILKSPFNYGEFLF